MTLISRRLWNPPKLSDLFLSFFLFADQTTVQVLSLRLPRTLVVQCPLMINGRCGGFMTLYSLVLGTSCVRVCVKLVVHLRSCCEEMWLIKSHVHFAGHFFIPASQCVVVKKW